jgi:hypothetical protein
MGNFILPRSPGERVNLEFIHTEIERMRRQISRQQKDIQGSVWVSTQTLFRKSLVNDCATCRCWFRSFPGGKNRA